MEVVSRVARAIALAAEVLATLIFVIGMIRAVFGFVRDLARRMDPFPPEEVRLGLARAISLALEFLLTATLLRTIATRPSWDDLGRVAALIGIRIAVNFFLTRDITREGEIRERDEADRHPT